MSLEPNDSLLLRSDYPELEASYEFSRRQIKELASLKQKVAAQAVVIEQMRGALQSCELVKINYPSDEQTHWMRFNVDEVQNALNLPTDSTQILQEWLDGVLGDPVGEIHKAHLNPVPDMEHWCKEILLYSPNNPGDSPKYRSPIFKRPEIKND